jgi:hypothetical protein
MLEFPPIEPASDVEVHPQPDPPAPQPTDNVEILAEWIFSRHQAPPRRSKDLLTEACKDPSLGTFTHKEFEEAYGRVYQSEAHRPPVTGWPLCEPYAARWRKEQQKKK